MTEKLTLKRILTLWLPLMLFLVFLLFAGHLLVVKEKLSLQLVRAAEALVEAASQHHVENVSTLLLSGVFLFIVNHMFFLHLEKVFQSACLFDKRKDIHLSRLIA